MNKKKLLILIASIVFVVAIILIIIFGNKKTITYNVSFDTNGGTLIETQIVEEGNKVSRPVNPLKEGYEFIEWTYLGETYDFNESVSSDMTLKAKWEIKKETVTYTVKFNTDGGTIIENQTIKEGEKVVEPETPKKDGYIFKGWTLNGKDFDFDETVNKDVELKAKWEKEKTKNNTSNKTNNTTQKPNNNNNSGNTQKPVTKYTVTFNSNGGSAVSSQTVNSGSKVTKPSNPTKSGYNFSGWLLNGNIYNFNTAVNSNITLTAKWTQKSYIVKATKVDAYSPDSKLTVYEEGNIISVKEIKYTDGVTLCSGSNTTVNTGDISGISSLIVVLNDGTQVSATLS